MESDFNKTIRLLSLKEPWLLANLNISNKQFCSEDFRPFWKPVKFSPLMGTHAHLHGARGHSPCGSAAPPGTWHSGPGFPSLAASPPGCGAGGETGAEVGTVVPPPRRCQKGTTAEQGRSLWGVGPFSDLRLCQNGPFKLTHPGMNIFRN